MRDPHAPAPLPPRDWSEAFAALPPETPPADALSGVFAELPASTPTRPGRQWWIAAAAMLALATVVPMWMSRHARVGGHPASLASSPESTASAPLQNHTPDAVPVLPVETASDRKTLDARLRGHDEQKHSTPVRVAKADRPHHKPHRMRKSPQASEPADTLMEPLYAESARLEALLALARDDRVASATALALGIDFEARLSGIDAALAQPSLDAKQRLALWRQRVDALRAYASFESTQRALAASGERYDAMLVSID
jgi:hypothetical protein